MVRHKASLKGRGPELFGRGVDLLFGDTEEDRPASEADQAAAPESAASAQGETIQAPVSEKEPPETPSPPREHAHGTGPGRPGYVDQEDYLLAAARALRQTTAAVPLSYPATAAGQAQAGAGDVMPGPAGGDELELDLPPLPQALAEPDGTLPAELAAGLAESADSAVPGDGQAVEPTALPPSQPAAETRPPMPAESPPTAEASPSAQVRPPVEKPPTVAESDLAAQEKAAVDIRTVGAPGVKIGGPVTEISGEYRPTDGQLSPEILERPKERLTAEDRQEILERLSARDLSKLDREVDELYDQVITVMSGEREATVAFDVLRRARQILLLEPERYAEAEYLVRQIRASLIRVEQSLKAGARYGPRLFIYQVVWLALFGCLAILTTVPDNFFFRWAAFILGVPGESEGLNWAMLLLSTLAWGGIGGVTGALWSLHYHISVARDFDAVENMWYLEQPVLGMVLGGIVYLIMASGFLVVQVDLSGPNAAFGARLLPSAIAVVAGFRQTVVLDLIERIVRLVAPQSENETPQRPVI